MQARRDLIKASTNQAKMYDVWASGTNILYAKNESLVVKGKPFIIQNLRKKLDKYAWLHEFIPLLVFPVSL